MSGWQIFVIAVVAFWTVTKGIPMLIEGFRQDLQERKEIKALDNQLTKLDDIGYKLGKAGAPPNFDPYPADDVMGHLALLSGYDRGMKERMKAEKKGKRRA